MGVVLPFFSKKDKILQDQMRKTCLDCVEQIKRRAETLKKNSDYFDCYLSPDEANALQVVADTILSAITTLEQMED